MNIFNFLSPMGFILSVVLVVEIVKLLQERVFSFSERARDIVYSVLAGVLVALLKVFNLVDIEWSIILPLLFSGQGVFVVIKKILGK